MRHDKLHQAARCLIRRTLQLRTAWQPDTHQRIIRQVQLKSSTEKFMWEVGGGGLRTGSASIVRILAKALMALLLAIRPCGLSGPYTACQRLPGSDAAGV